MPYNRREFLHATLITIGSVSLGGTLASLVQSCSNSNPTDPNGTGNQQPASINLDLTQPANQNMANVGGTLAFGANMIDSQGILLFRVNASEVHAYSRRCTHSGCTIGAFNSNGRSNCPCHGSSFNTSGNVVNGPATAPLKQYTTKLENNVLTVSS